MQRVLIIDDDQNIAKLLDKVLTAGGFETKVVHDGRTGIITAKSFSPHLIVTDIFMPDMDGFEVILELRRTCSAAKIIAISGQQALGKTQMARTLEAIQVDAFLEKPIGPKELLATVREKVQLS